MLSVSDLPDDFISLFKDSFSHDLFTKFVDSFLESSPVSFRINRYKYRDSLALQHRVEWCQSGYYLEHRPSFSSDPLFFAGAYYVQEASSMFIEQAVNRVVEDAFIPKRVLDLCASPGGKATHLLSLLDRSSLLVANEVVRSRASVLSDNIRKWGCPNVIVSNNDPADFKSLVGYFDLVMADLPCSGEGMFRKNPAAIEQWSRESVNLCAARQRRITGDIWSSLRPGGYMIYSTCTFNSIENDANIRWIVEELGAEVIEVISSEQACEWGVIRTQAGGYQFIPGVAKGEGFYCALLRKSQNNSDSDFVNQQRERDRYLKRVKTLNPNDLFEEIPLEGEFKYLLKNDIVKAFPTEMASEMIYVESMLKVVHSGIAVSRLAGSKLLLPHRDLARSVDLKQSLFTEVELEKENAAKVIDSIPLILRDYPKGYILLKYEGLPLAIVKNIGNRINYL